MGASPEQLQTVVASLNAENQQKLKNAFQEGHDAHPSEVPATPITLLVQKIGGDEPLSVEVMPTATIDDVKTLIHNQVGIRPNLQTLVFGELDLKVGTQTLSELNVTSGSTLNLIVAVAFKGGYFRCDSRETIPAIPANGLSSKSLDIVYELSLLEDGPGAFDKHLNDGRTFDKSPSRIAFTFQVVANGQILIDGHHNFTVIGEYPKRIIMVKACQQRIYDMHKDYGIYNNPHGIYTDKPSAPILNEQQ